MFFDFVYDGGVLENAAVVRKVNFGGLLRQLLDAASGIFVAFLESLERGCGVAAETERLGYFRPVEFKGCAALWLRGRVSTVVIRRGFGTGHKNEREVFGIVRRIAKSALL